MSCSKGRIHVVIGDTQAKPGVPTNHMSWMGQYIVDHFAENYPAKDVTLIHVGDHWDMPSLSSYDFGTKSAEGRRVRSDIDAGNRAFDLLCEPLAKFNKGRPKSKQWWPDRHLTLGNHEDRITRACELDAKLDGVISLDQLNASKWGWKVHEFKKPVVIDGVHYAHFFYNPNTGRPYSGENLHLRLKTIGHTFTMGHQQGCNYAMRPVGDHMHHGLVVGSTYLHNEKYLGPQTRKYWRGIVVCHQVERGSYDPMFISLDYLCRRYTGKTLKQSRLLKAA